ncbi:MAG: hypothetical protein IJV16_05215 [Lachnospiraceae bacterium]|nr:hypothetical protein [Lachnospiraceae bacterium]MBR1524674.1 hypothetical protein [Lachnospiraceae bacterium]
MSKVDKVEPVVKDDEELLSEEELQDIEKEVNESEPEERKEGRKSIYVLLEEEIMG